MPRFYFDVAQGQNFIPDDEGFQMESLDAAEHEATQALIQLGRDWLARAREISIQVRDERNRQMLTLSIAMKTELLEHLPRSA